MIQLDPASPRPLSLQLAHTLRQQIDTGVWQRNTRLLAGIELASQFEGSRGIVRQAMDLLVNQGLLQRIPVKGMFVIQPDPHVCSQLIGRVVPYLRDSFITDVLRGVETVLLLRLRPLPSPMSAHPPH